jgi:phosphatidylserine decarboxylase
VVLAVLAVVGAVMAGFFVNFFRDPERVTPAAPDLVVSPADGKVIIVERDIDEPRF